MSINGLALLIYWFLVNFIDKYWKIGLLFSTNFISASEKTSLGLKKQAANFYFTFTQSNFHFDFFSSEKWMATHYEITDMLSFEK